MWYQVKIAPISSLANWCCMVMLFFISADISKSNFWFVTHVTMPMILPIVINVQAFLSKAVWGITKSKLHRTQSAFTCSKLTIETLEQGVKHVQS